ncbi:unnamed protein product, partial [marine sediment metagenome]
VIIPSHLLLYLLSVWVCGRLRTLPVSASILEILFSKKDQVPEDG